jgi:D-alanyl-D-alanine carboxypeptidase
MVHSHFADPSGIDPASESTASDILKVAALDMASPTVRALVQMPNVTLPLAGTIGTYTPLLGVQGILGVKSGYTSEAGGCDVVAVVRPVAGRQVLILAAVTGQTGPNVLDVAGLHGLQLVDTVQPLIRTARPVRGGQIVAHVTAAGSTVDATAASSVSVLTWPGASGRTVFHAGRITEQTRTGAIIGTVTVDFGTQRVVVPVRLQEPVPQESLLQRLF